MTITESVRAFIATCPFLPALSNVTVNELAGEIGSFSVDPLPGARTTGASITGNKTKEFPFVLSSLACTADELSRLSSSEFYEKFAEWLDECTDADVLPELGDGKTAESMEATTWAYLFQREDDGACGIYQINCKLTYEQKARKEAWEK